MFKPVRLTAGKLPILRKCCSQTAVMSNGSATAKNGEVDSASLHGPTGMVLEVNPPGAHRMQSSPAVFFCDGNPY